ncbi:hypothetical protein QJS10_CPA08g00681 [Acorus calamus]|uniref:GrpE protein homolog n=1 Tax=Acorus calamus TaxID=4465 RepID=A0AAV9EDJ1_ACOCL|nr:hypothetical protein QJS10_CPA08g00681 [Acorus calamus]
MSLSTYGPPLSQTLLTPSKTLIALKSKSSLNPSSSSDRGRPPLLRTLSSFSSFGHGFHRRRKVSLNVAHSDRQTITGEEDEENVRGGKSNKNLPGLKILLKSYKEAILDGDEKTVADIGAMIHNIERAKDELLQRSTELTTDVASERVNFLRLKADFENFRKRSDKDRLNLTSDAQREVLEGLLSIVDSFERSKQQIKLETEREKKINTSYQGIYKQFVEVMRSWRVSVVETVGKPFDPSLHEAIARKESKQFKAGIIIQELRRGFVVGDRLLRPADVKVSTGLGSKSAPSGVLQESIEQTTEGARPDGS